MTHFSISRIHTSHGIFRLSGRLHRSEAGNRLDYSKVEFMGTDGWCEMDLASEHTTLLLFNIEANVFAHILEKNS